MHIQVIMVLSAGIVPIRAGSVLLLRSYRYWDFPKGRLEPGEKPRAAALRELSEETGITDARILAGGQYRETLPYSGAGGKKIARYYVAEVCPGKPICLTEHNEYRWVTFAQARELVAPRLLPIVEWAESVLTGDVLRKVS